jgi:hypothetical protein
MLEILSQVFLKDNNNNRKIIYKLQGFHQNYQQFNNNSNRSKIKNKLKETRNR